MFFRIVAYNDAGFHGCSDFVSAQALLKALNTALPDFPGWVHLLNEFRDGENSIISSGEISLDSSQRKALGLN